MAGQHVAFEALRKVAANMARLFDVHYIHLGIGFTPREFCVLELLTNVQDCSGARS